MRAETARGTARNAGLPIGLPERDPFRFTCASAAFVLAEIRSASNAAKDERMETSIRPSGESSESASCSEKSTVPPARCTSSTIRWKSSEERASLSTLVATIACAEPERIAAMPAASPGRLRVERPEAPSSSSIRTSEKPAAHAELLERPTLDLPPVPVLCLREADVADDVHVVSLLPFVDTEEARLSTGLISSYCWTSSS